MFKHVQTAVLRGKVIYTHLRGEEGSKFITFDLLSSFSEILISDVVARLVRGFKFGGSYSKRFLNIVHTCNLLMKFPSGKIP